MPPRPDNQHGPELSGVEHILAELANLQSAGRNREALTCAIEWSQLYQDPRLTREVMRLRHHAFQVGAARKDWPPAFPDLFSGARIPEIRASELNARGLGSGILHHGALVVRGLAEAAVLSSLRDCIDKALDEAGKQQSDPSPGESPFYSRCPETEAHDVAYARAFAENMGSAVLAGDSPHTFAMLLELYEKAGVISSVEEYLGERPVLSLAKTVLRRVPITTGTDWHQDGAFLGTGIRVVNVWLAVTDCGIDAPGMDLVAKRIPRILETGTNGAQYDWSVGPETLIIERLDQHVLSPVFEAGDAIMFDQFSLHRTGIRDGMTKTRYAVEAWMFAPSTFPLETFPLVM